MTFVIYFIFLRTIIACNIILIDFYCHCPSSLIKIFYSSYHLAYSVNSYILTCERDLINIYPMNELMNVFPYLPTAFLVKKWTLFFVIKLDIPWETEGFPGGSVVKHPPHEPQETQVQSVGWENPLQYSCLENPHRQKKLVGYSLLCHKESDTTEATQHAHMGDRMKY